MWVFSMQLGFWKIIDVLKKLLHDSSFMVWKSWIHVFIILKMIFQASGHDKKKESKQEVHINSSDFLYIKKWICESSLLPAWQKHNYSLSYHDLFLYVQTAIWSGRRRHNPRERRNSRPHGLALCPHLAGNYVLTGPLAVQAAVWVYFNV